MGNELLTLKTDFGNLEMINKFVVSNDFDSSKPTNCEDCVVLKKKVDYLIKTASRLSMGTTNLNAIVLGSENCVFEKTGIGYQCGFKRKQKKFNTFFRLKQNQSSPLINCFYCMKKGHSVRNCNIRKFDVPKCLVWWVPKGITNIYGPKFNRVPNFKT